MTVVAKPTTRPANPNFSSGPCAKRPGFSLDALANACLGRSHRAKIGKERLKDVIERSKTLLGVPADYLLGIVPASDTGAVEMALWSLLGPRGVDVLAW
jgi:phosphoserine aminotransferase